MEGEKEGRVYPARAAQPGVRLDDAVLEHPRALDEDEVRRGAQGPPAHRPARQLVAYGNFLVGASRHWHAREVCAELRVLAGIMVFDEVLRELVERERGLVDRARAPDARDLEPALCVARALRREVRSTKW